MKKNRYLQAIEEAFGPDPLDDPERIKKWLAFQKEQRLKSKRKAAAKKKKAKSKMRKELGIGGFTRVSFNSSRKLTRSVSGGLPSLGKRRS
jgi:hypothetical protein